MTEIILAHPVEDSEAFRAYRKSIDFYKQRVIQHRGLLEKLKECKLIKNSKLVNATLKKINSDYVVLENQVNSFQCVGQLIGDVLKKISDDHYIVRTSNGPRYVVGVKKDVQNLTKS
ncbi:hypothetical protein HZS_2305 [Henneguya salminicola]|nr:hypothetical protein HZS_2305 [Henneguya salminicola]